MIGAIQPLVQPAHVETACDAPLLPTVSTQEEESFLQSVFERVSWQLSKTLHWRYHWDARHQQQVARAATNELGPACDNCGHGHLSLINNIKAIYLTGSFLITRMKVRYKSPNHYLLLVSVYVCCHILAIRSVCLLL